MTTAKKPRGKTVKLSKPPSNTSKAARTPGAKARPKKAAPKKKAPAKKATAVKAAPKAPPAKKAPAKKATATRKTAAKKPAPKKTTPAVAPPKNLVAETKMSKTYEASLPDAVREDGKLHRGFTFRYVDKANGYIETLVACSKYCKDTVSDLLTELGYKDDEVRRGTIFIYRSECSVHTYEGLGDDDEA